MEQKIINKFNANIFIKENGCWNWIGFTDKNGLPIIRSGDPTKEYSCRRISLQLHNKELIDTKHVLPYCGNKLCVNPDHLVCGDTARFWSKVQKLTNDCWIWIAGEDKNGYGKFTYYDNGKKITVRANRYAFMLRYEFMPSPNSFICHTCDNPRCVNPDHLFMGTNQENVDDRVLKGRSASGERHGSSKLKASQILEIKSLINELSERRLAKLYGVAKSTIHSIIKNRTWKNVVGN